MLRQKTPRNDMNKLFSVKPYLALLPSVCLDRWTGADEVTIAIGIVNSPDRRPEFILFEVWYRIRRFLTRVGVFPLIRHDLDRRVRGILENIVDRMRFAVVNFADFPANGQHGFAKTVELSFQLAFRGLDHHGAGDRRPNRFPR